jgi:hypothetical protein
MLWSLISQSCINKPSQGFAARLELCLANDGLSMSSQLFEMTDGDVVKSFMTVNRARVSWTPGEDKRLLYKYLTNGAK